MSLASASASSIESVNAMPETAMTTGFGTGSRQTPNGSYFESPASAFGPFAATAGPTTARSSPAEK